MKILKLKAILFSLMAIAMVTVFLTSCEKQEMLNETLAGASSENLLVKAEGAKFILPYGYDKLSEEAKDEYLDSLDDESFTKLVKSNKVATYFAYLGKYEMLESIAKYGDIYDQNTLVLHLTRVEIENFSSTDFAAIIELRGCGNWKTVSECVLKKNNFRYSCWCYDISMQKKQKKVCKWWPDKYRWVDC